MIVNRADLDQVHRAYVARDEAAQLYRETVEATDTATQRERHALEALKEARVEFFAAVARVWPDTGEGAG